MKKKIRCIEKGWGDGSTFFTTEVQRKTSEFYVDEIRCIEKSIGKGYYNDVTIEVFCGYVDNKLIFEIEANSSLTVVYYK